jgi:carbonic anhydrase/acetyltransferase-like protein (isoleucine patch superfamily)
MLIEYQGKRPHIGPDVFIAPTAVIIGDVEIARGASVWYGVVLRGDMEKITIGEDTNIQDNCTVHTDYGYPTVIGDRISVGHNAVVHGCTLGDHCLIGMNAVVLSGAHIKENSVVAAGSVVREGQIAGPSELLAGTPAVVKRTLTSESTQRFRQPVEDYRELSRRHRGEIHIIGSQR